MSKQATLVLCSWILLLVSGCQEKEPTWKETGDGVVYRWTCIEGMKYIVTPGSHGEMSVSGPVKEC